MEKIFSQKRAALIALCALVFSSLLFAGVASQLEPKDIVLVNSRDWRDAVSGALFAAENNYSYSFVLTEAHGNYWISLLKNSHDRIYYFESSNPVLEGMGDRLLAIGSNSIQVSKENSLYDLFAKKEGSKFALIVGSSDGAEAISAAPYAALRQGSLYFADEKDACALSKSLADRGTSVLVYGSVANSMAMPSAGGAQIQGSCGSPAFASSINTGSPYLDNVRLLSLYRQRAKPAQVIFSSGKTFEKSLVSAEYPSALLGRTEASPELLSWIRQSGISNGLVFAGDADLSGALASIKKETGLAVFAKLGEGYSGDSQMQPLAVMQIESPNVMLTVGSIKYDAASQGFGVLVKNEGNCPLYARAVVALPDGSSSSSEQAALKLGESKTIFVPLDSARFLSVGSIPSLSLEMYSGQDKYVVESVDVVNYTNVPSWGKPPLISIPRIPQADQTYYGSQQMKGGEVLSFAVVAVLIIACGYIYIYSTKGKKAENATAPKFEADAEQKIFAKPKKAKGGRKKK